MTDSVYLDHHATTPPLPEVIEAVADTMRRYPANPASQHQLGREARRVLETSRERIGQLLGARTAGRHPDRVIFTSGGTEANNLLLAGLLAERQPGHLVSSQIEHPAVAEPLEMWRKRGWRITFAAPDPRGIVSAEAVSRALGDDTTLVTVMAANNETGVLQPLSEIGQLCAERGIPLHTDAAQLAGKLPVDFSAWQLAALTAAAHKFHGPRGIGVLVLRADLNLVPQLFGGHQQEGLRPGTEVVALAVGMQVALEAWQKHAASRAARLAQLQQVFEASLKREIPTAVVIGSEAERLPTVSNVAFPGVDRQAFFLALDLAGVACSTGSACASGSSEVSPVHVAMGLSRELCEGALRFSWGATTAPAELHAAVNRILLAYKQIRRAIK